MPVLLLGTFFWAEYLRLHFLIVRGGLESDQLEWAKQFYNGGLSTNYLDIRDGLLAGRIDPHWIYMPGYPALLAILKLSGLDLQGVRIVQSSLDAVAVFPLFYVIRRLTGSGAMAVLGAAAYAVSPWWALGAGYLLGESLIPAFVIGVLAGMVWTAENHESDVRWFTLGLCTAILPFFRSEMVLLAGPLIVWATLVSAPGRRLPNAAIVGAAFAAPVLAWCLRNYLVGNHFALVPSVYGYALWSGLGQVTNDFGYLVSDQRATELLQSHGIQFNTPASEVFWKSEYLRAWNEHPRHVLESFLYRVRLICTRCDYDYYTLGKLCNVVYGWLAWCTLLALIALLWSRRWLEAFIVSGPMLYALVSLGFIYVEPRYVRYAGLTYLLGSTIFLALVANFVSRHLRPIVRRDSAHLIRAGMAAVGLVELGVNFAGHRAALARDEYATLISAARPAVDTDDRPDVTIQSLSFEPAKSAVSVTKTPSGIEIAAGQRPLLYLATAGLNTNNADAARIRAHIKLQYGDPMLGILSQNKRLDLGNQDIAGPAGTVQSFELVSPVEAGSQIAFFGNKPAPPQGIKFEVQSLDITYLCIEGPVRFMPLYLFDRTLPRIHRCNRAVFTHR